MPDQRYRYDNDPTKWTEFPKAIHQRDEKGNIVKDPMWQQKGTHPDAAAVTIVVNNKEEEEEAKSQLWPGYAQSRQAQSPFKK